MNPRSVLTLLAEIAYGIIRFLLTLDEAVQARFNVPSRWLQETLHINPYRWGSVALTLGEVIACRYNFVSVLWLILVVPLVLLAWPLRPAEQPTLHHQMAGGFAARVRSGVCVTVLFNVFVAWPFWAAAREWRFFAAEPGIFAMYLGLLLLAGPVVPPSQYRRVEVPIPAPLPEGAP